MMKKLLLSGMLAFGSFAAAFSQAASCTPDFSCLPGGATEGICPDSATGLPAGTIGTAYNTTVSIKIPATFETGGTNYNLSHLGLTDVTVDTSGTGTYVPLSAIGLDYLGSGANTPSGASAPAGVTMTKYGYWSAPGSACAILSGTPTKTGTFPLRIKSLARVIIFSIGTWQPAPDNDQYSITINMPAGIESPEALKFSLEQNHPNPFSDKTFIRFTAQEQGQAELRVYNMLGSVVMNKMLKAEKGNNSIQLDAGAFAPGVYMYSIRNGNKTITKRMIVSR